LRNIHTVIGFFPGKGAGQAERFYFVATPTEERNQSPDETVDVDGRDKVELG